MGNVVALRLSQGAQVDALRDLVEIRSARERETDTVTRARVVGVPEALIAEALGVCVRTVTYRYGARGGTATRGRLVDRDQTVFRTVNVPAQVTR